MFKYLYLSRLRPPSGQPQSCMDRRLALIQESPGLVLPGQRPTGLGACSYPPPPPLLLPTLPVSCLVWRVPFVAEDQAGERPVLPCDGSWGCDPGRGQYGGATITGAGACVLPCLVVPLSDGESWKGALSPPTRVQDLGLR